MNISKDEYVTLVSTKYLLIQANEIIQEQRRIIDRLLAFEPKNIRPQCKGENNGHQHNQDKD